MSAAGSELPIATSQRRTGVNCEHEREHATTTPRAMMTALGMRASPIRVKVQSSVGARHADRRGAGDDEREARPDRQSAERHEERRDLRDDVDRALQQRRRARADEHDDRHRPTRRGPGSRARRAPTPARRATAIDRSMPPHRITSIAPDARIMSGTAESSSVQRLAGRRKLGFAIAIAGDERREHDHGHDRAAAAGDVAARREPRAAVATARAAGLVGDVHQIIRSRIAQRGRASRPAARRRSRRHGRPS